MKKLIVTAGCAALGAASLHAAYAPGLTKTETGKPWSVSATLRGFYDDNYTTSSSALQRSSVGMAFSPTISVNLPLDQTLLTFKYKYGVYYYQDRSGDPFDQSHEFDATLQHQFSPRYKLTFDESFVIAQEPEVLAPTGGALPSFLRTQGNNMRNLAKLDFYAQLTDLLGLVAGYSNTYYDYEQSGTGSRSALLDRDEHLGSLDLRWQARTDTVGVIGYQFGLVNYTSGELISAGLPFRSEIRDNRSHYLYVGADHQFNPRLNAQARIGGEYREYVNVNDSQVSPYLDGSVTYLYGAKGSFAQLGVKHSRNQTDVGVYGGGSATLDVESTVVYGSVNHQLTPNFAANLLAQYQDSSFNGGGVGVDGKGERFFTVGLSLAYKINEHWLAETGYNYDRLNSDLVGRDFTRNRIFLGIKAVY